MQLPSLHRSMQEAAKILGVEPPELYIRQAGYALPERRNSPMSRRFVVLQCFPRTAQSAVAHQKCRQAYGACISLALALQSPTPNAYTLAVSGRRPFVVVHSALLELLTPLEVQSVLGHELGHLKVGAGPLLDVSFILEATLTWRCTPCCPAAACSPSHCRCAEATVAAARHSAAACHDVRNICEIRMHISCALPPRSASTACG